MDFSSQAIFGLGIVVIIHSKPEYILPSSSAIEYTTCLPTREDPSEQRFVTTHMSTDAFLLPALWYDLQGRDVHSVGPPCLLINEDTCAMYAKPL